MLGKHTLGPKETTSLKIIFATEGRPGPFRKTVTLSIDGPTVEEMEIAMEGTVREAPVPKIKVVPRRVDLGGVAEGKIIEQEFAVTNTGTVPLVVSRISAQLSRKVFFPESKEERMVIAPGATKKLKLPLKVDRPSGEYEEEVLIESNAKNAPKGGYVIMVRNDGS